MPSEAIFSGIMAPMVTPVDEKFSIDHRALERLINHMIEGGIHGIFILGTTGEASSLSYAQRKELIKSSGHFINNRVPFWVGITDTSFQESVELANFASQYGAAAVVAAPPFYIPIAQSELIYYYQYLANACKLPLYLYNFPSLTKIEISPETVKQLSAHPNIWGIKDSSNNIEYLKKLLALDLKRPFNWLLGPEAILCDSLAMGAHGGVNGGANLFPKLYVKAYDIFRNGTSQQKATFQKLINLVGSTVFKESYLNAFFLKGLKAALAAENICENFMMLPLQPYDSKTESEIIESVKAIKEQLALEL